MSLFLRSYQNQIDDWFDKFLILFMFGHHKERSNLVCFDHFFIQNLLTKVGLTRVEIDRLGRNLNTIFKVITSLGSLPLPTLIFQSSFVSVQSREEQVFFEDDTVR